MQLFILSNCSELFLCSFSIFTRGTHGRCSVWEHQAEIAKPGMELHSTKRSSNAGQWSWGNTLGHECVNPRLAFWPYARQRRSNGTVKNKTKVHWLVEAIK